LSGSASTNTFALSDSGFQLLDIDSASGRPRLIVSMQPGGDKKLGKHKEALDFSRAS